MRNPGKPPHYAEKYGQTTTLRRESIVYRITVGCRPAGCLSCSFSVNPLEVQTPQEGGIEEGAPGSWRL